MIDSQILSRYCLKHGSDVESKLTSQNIVMPLGIQSIYVCCIGNITLASIDESLS